MPSIPQRFASSRPLSPIAPRRPPGRGRVSDNFRREAIEGPDGREAPLVVLREEVDERGVPLAAVVRDEEPVDVNRNS